MKRKIIKIGKDLEQGTITNKEAQNPQLNISPITCDGFSVGDKVNTPSGIGIVWKVTEVSVHVKHHYDRGGIEWIYSKYLVQTKHHSQSHVSVLSHCR